MSGGHYIGHDARIFIVDELGAGLSLAAIEAPLITGVDFGAGISALEAELAARKASRDVVESLAPRNRKERRAEASRRRRK